MAASKRQEESAVRKSAVYCVILAAALIVPRDAVELGKIKPVEAVSIKQSGVMIRIDTDTGDVGSGKTVEEAMKNLEDTTEGRIFLDTAAYLLVGEGAEQQIAELSKHLKRSVRICKMDASIKPADVVEFLRTHEPETRLEQWNIDGNPEMLQVENGRLILVKNPQK